MELLKMAQLALSNQTVRAMVSRSFEMRDSALKLQSGIMEGLNLPTASDLATLTGRIRSLSTRLELLEDSVARIERGVARLQVDEQTNSDPRTTGSDK